MSYKRKSYYEFDDFFKKGIATRNVGIATVSHCMYTVGMK
jgi:hypothetical protein